MKFNFLDNDKEWIIGMKRKAGTFYAIKFLTATISTGTVRLPVVVIYLTKERHNLFILTIIHQFYGKIPTRPCFINYPFAVFCHQFSFLLLDSSCDLSKIKLHISEHLSRLLSPYISKESFLTYLVSFFDKFNIQATLPDLPDDKKINFRLFSYFLI